MTGQQLDDDAAAPELEGDRGRLEIILSMMRGSKWLERQVAEALGY